MIERIAQRGMDVCVVCAVGSRPIKFAYVVSFDRLPVDGLPLIGPIEYRRTQPTLDEPEQFLERGFTMISRLRRVILYTLNDRIILARTYQ